MTASTLYLLQSFYNRQYLYHNPPSVCMYVCLSITLFIFGTLLHIFPEFSGYPYFSGYPVFPNHNPEGERAAEGGVYASVF